MYDKSYGEFPVGEALYTSHLHFCCPTKIYDAHIIKEIKGIKYCKDSGTPPYATLAETPFDFMQRFDIYDTEIGIIKRAIKIDEEKKKK